MPSSNPAAQPLPDLVAGSWGPGHTSRRVNACATRARSPGLANLDALEVELVRSSVVYLAGVDEELSRLHVSQTTAECEPEYAGSSV